MFRIPFSPHLVVMISMIAVLPACGDEVVGSGIVVTEERPIDDISGIDLATLGDLTVEMGAEPTLRVEAEDNIIEFIDTTTSGGVLTISKSEDVDISPTLPVRYYVTVRTIDLLRATSSGSIHSTDLSATAMQISLASSGRVTLSSLTADELHSTISSSGSVAIYGGEVRSQNIKLTSSGAFRAGDLGSAVTQIDVDSSGGATVWATDRLDANLSSSGSVRYYGSPTLNIHRSSSGSVSQLGHK